jgi:amidohydrolase
MTPLRLALVACPFALCVFGGPALAVDRSGDLDRAVQAVAPKVIAWRHDIHANPELGYQETRTAALVARELRALKFDEVQTGVARTGVIGVLRGGKPGPVVALRADMDALPVQEPAGSPYGSTKRATWNGKDVPVMHACGHDAHVAILLGAAEVLAGQRAQIAGTIVFVFQPAEEGGEEGQKGGAKLMLEEGALSGARAPSAIFGLHVWPGVAGTISTRPGGQNASADELKITVHGKQTHGALPWHGVDPIITAAQIMIGLQMIPARQLNATKAASVVTIGSIHGGVRSNIIPDRVDMQGTIRTFDPQLRNDMHARIRQTATSIAASAGASADVAIETYAPVNYNDPALTARMLPTLRAAVGADKVQEMEPLTGAEDFAFFAERFPSLYVFLGVNPPGVANGAGAPNHSPNFTVNDDALTAGTRTMALLALDYLAGASDKKKQN